MFSAPFALTGCFGHLPLFPALLALFAASLAVFTGLFETVFQLVTIFLMFLFQGVTLLFVAAF